MSILEPSDVTLREWLENPDRSIDRLECLHIFRQIVEIVNVAHLQGVVIHNIRPSCFVMSSFNCISFIESESCSSSGSDSNNEPVNLVDQNKVGELSSLSPVSCGRTQRSLPTHEDSKLEKSLTITYPQDSEGNGQAGVFQSDAEILSCLRSTSAFARTSSFVETKECDRQETWRTMPSKQILSVEINWYTSPEEASGAPSTYASDVYRLGVLLFELFSAFSTVNEKLRMMSNLRHRVLPPQLLLKWPKVASFCLWLLHPQPHVRPRMSEVLQSEFLDESRDNAEEREAAIKIKEEIEGQELLLQFLLQVKQKKQEEADRLHDIVGCLSSDIEEVVVQQSFLLKENVTRIELKENNGVGLEKLEGLPSVGLKDSASLCSRKRSQPSTDDYKSNIDPGSSNDMMIKSSRMMRNFEKLEVAYFSTRIKTVKPAPAPRSQSRGSPGSSTVRASNMRMEESNFSTIDNLATRGWVANARQRGSIDPFLDGLCKYLSYSRVKVRANLKQADLLNSSNLVCSMSFDRDKEFFATAGVNRKIKVFECNMVLNEDLDIHYPVIEMLGRSKVSSVCWNSYIKNQIASSDFDGVVQVWDSTRGQVFMDLREHEKRVWSVDFSKADPTRLASGGDDGAVKLWNINQGTSIGTIKTKANVCCVQFSPNSAHTIAVGSADHKVYLYDLRNTRVPCCTLVSHMKTVSCVKFIDSTTLVSASTDNTLKLWDLSVDSSRVITSPSQTFKGHTNLKNFVGLSVFDGYIATGSETNEVFIYYKAFPVPVLSYKFDSNDPLTGREIYDAPQFISCVCWRGQSSMLVAANSTGNIKILQLV